MMHLKPAIYWVKLESGLLTEYDMLPMSHCQVLPPLFPLQVEKEVIGSQQELPCGSIGMVTPGQGPAVDGFPTSLIPYKLLIHAVKAGALMKRSCRTVLNKARSWRGVIFQGAPWTCLAPKFQWQHASGGCAVDGSTSQIHMTSNSTLLHAFMSKCKHFMPKTYRG